MPLSVSCAGEAGPAGVARATLDVVVLASGSSPCYTSPEDFAINWRYEVHGRDITNQFLRFLAVESELRQVRQKRDTERLTLLQQLAEAGLSQRAIGDAAGLSRQRVGQLIRK